nr:unnamed protein product [Digitaria exilis]
MAAADVFGMAPSSPPLAPNPTPISHLAASLEEELAAAEAVDGGDGHERRHDVDQPGDHRRHERRVPTEPDRLEQHGRVEHDDVDAGELLEERDGHRHGELRPVPALEDVQPRRPSSDAARRYLTAGRRHEVVVLVFYVIRSADAAQDLPRVLVVAAVDERVGRVREEQRAHGDDARRHGGEAEAETPSPAGLDLGRAVVDEVGGEDADGDHQLEADVQHAAEAVRRHLRQSDLERTYQAGEADADAEKDTTDDEHGDVPRGGVEGGAGEEGDAAAEHAPSPAERARDGGHEEGGGERGQVERRRERGQQLAVELAVLAAAPGRTLLAIED